MPAAGEEPAAKEPIDVVLLTHNRLDYLVRTVDALEERTPEPIRLTVVDNASEPDVRNWLADNRERFHQLILRPTNEAVPGFQHGIEATTSDPFVLADPDLVVPDVSPSWLARLLETMRRHPDVGLVGADFDDASYPSSLSPEQWASLKALRGRAREVDEHLTEGNLGTWFQLIRRDALRDRYLADYRACNSVRKAGYRVGWNPQVRVHHLGAYDYERYPQHVVTKSNRPGLADYRVLLERDARPPRLAELAMAGPLVALTRAAGVSDRSVLELAWGAPAAGAAVDGTVTLHEPESDELPFGDGAAGAAILLDPPPARVERLIREAARIAARMVVLVAPLGTVGARLAAELAPPGWRGTEQAGPGQLALALADAGDRHGVVSEDFAMTTVEHRDRWLALFAAGDFGASERRVFLLERIETRAAPESVTYDQSAVSVWRPEPPASGYELPRARPKAIATFALRRLRRAGRRARVRLARLARR